MFNTTWTFSTNGLNTKPPDGVQHDMDILSMETETVDIVTCNIEDIKSNTSFLHSLFKYVWICIKLIALIRIISVGFYGNNTMNNFTNNGFQKLKQKLAIAIT